MPPEEIEWHKLDPCCCVSGVWVWGVVRAGTQLETAVLDDTHALLPPPSPFPPPSPLLTKCVCVCVRVVC